MDGVNNNRKLFGELTELHVHVGSAVDVPMLWEIAHEQGIRLPTKDYWEFQKLITVSGVTTYQKYLDLFHWTELIQSSPDAMERSIYSIASGAYRKNNITKIEIRFNPMKRNRGGERDLDHIITASLHGMDKAMLSYPIKVGLIFCLDRKFSLKLNDIIVRKAIKYAKRGVVGVDIAGSIDRNFSFKEIAPLLLECRKSGLGITVHTGEATGADEVKEVMDLINPERIGHGIRSVDDDELLKLLNENNTLLEICPSSNLNTGVVKNLAEFKKIFTKLKKYNIKFSINTDGPEMLKTKLFNEYMLLLENGILTKEELLASAKNAAAASFIHE